MLEKASLIFQLRRNSLPKLGLDAVVHMISSVTLGGIVGKDCILSLRSSSWDI